MKHSGHNKGASGWYYIVRGSVQMVTVSQQDRDSSNNSNNNNNDGNDDATAPGPGGAINASGE